MRIKKYQEGGMAPEMAPEAQAAPMGPQAAPAAEQDPIMQIAQMAAQALQGQDCEAAMAVCEAFLGLLQQASQEQAAPVEAAPQGEPVFKRGGKLVGRK